MNCGIAAVFTASLAATGALAQTGTNLSPPPERFAVSPGGVDMRSGRYAYTQTDLSIGGEAGLSLTRSMPQQVAGHNNPFANFSHNFDILLSEKRINIQEGNFRHTAGQPDYQIEISFAGRSETFRSYSLSAGFDQTSRSGYAQLTFTGSKSSSSVVYTLRTGDGTEAVFRPLGTAAAAECSSVLRCAYVAQVTHADGTRLTFEYDNLGGQNTTRLRSVTSSRGYALLLEYSGTLVTKACVINLTLTPIPGNNVCPGNALATSTYAYASVGSSTRLASVTDPAGEVWSFVNAPLSIGFLNPDETTPWMTYSFDDRMNDDGLVEQIASSQEYADGSSYTYGFNESPFVEGHISQIAGGSFTDATGAQTTLTYAFPVAPFSMQSSCTQNGCPFFYYENTPQFTNSYQITPGPTTASRPALAGRLAREARSLEQGARTKLANAADHERRAAEFARNPTVRPGMERQSREAIARQQRERIDRLRRDAAEFRRQAAEDLARARRLREQASELTR